MIDDSLLTREEIENEIEFLEEADDGAHNEDRIRWYGLSAFRERNKHVSQRLSELHKLLDEMGEPTGEEE